MAKRFQRRREDFVCEHCGAEVSGDGYTDHCPECLMGKHVDVFPGDRAETCGGMMEPVDVEYGPDTDILYRCERCGKETRNRASEDDNRELLVEIMKISAHRKMLKPDV